MSLLVFSVQFSGLLAQATGIPAETVGIIIGAVIVSLISGGVLGKKVSDSTRTTIDPQPLRIELEKDFVAKPDFNVYRAEARAELTRVENNIARMADRVDTKHLELLATIERAAQTGVDGRVALWNELKPLGQEVAALKATSNVADQLGKLATVLKDHGKGTGIKG